MNGQQSAFDIESIESYEYVELVFEHDYNDISVVFTTNHVTPELLNEINKHCYEPLHVYDVCASGVTEKVRVSFEF